MKMEVNRRMFLALLGAVAAAAAVKPRRRAPASGARMPDAVPEGISFYAESRGQPAGRPRSAAVIYLPSNERF